MNLSINNPTIVIESEGKIVFQHRCKVSKYRTIAQSFIKNNLCIDGIPIAPYECYIYFSSKVNKEMNYINKPLSEKHGN